MEKYFAIGYMGRFRKLNNIFDRLIDDLEEFLLCDELTEKQIEKWERRYGKESIASMAIKLVSTLSKIFPMEQKVMVAINNSKDKKIQDISKEDVEIIKRYLEKVREADKKVEGDEREQK